MHSFRTRCVYVFVFCNSFINIDDFMLKYAVKLCESLTLTTIIQLTIIELSLQKYLLDINPHLMII